MIKVTTSQAVMRIDNYGGIRVAHAVEVWINGVRYVAPADTGEQAMHMALAACRALGIADDSDG